MLAAVWLVIGGAMGVALGQIVSVPPPALNAVLSTLTLGGGTTMTQVRVYTPSLTPGQLAAAIGVTEQTFSVTGLTTADKVIVNGPGPAALCPLVTARVSGADTLALGFVDLTIALCTPAAGTYTVVAFRS